MKKKRFVSAALIAVSLILFGCKQEEVVEDPVEEVLSAAALNDLESGHCYVKSGNSFYLLPVEDCNFDPTKPAQSTEGKLNGMTSPSENRIVGFIHKDMAIPTLYKNDQLVYVSDGSVSEFTWERFKDCGYSIGFSGLILGESGKIKSSSETACSADSTLDSAYYYEGKDGKILTYYEWQEENGIAMPDGQTPTQAKPVIDAEDYEERYCISVDNTQDSMSVTVAYRYMDEESRVSASQNGTFPRVYLINPMGESITLMENEGKTYSTDNRDGYTYLEAAVNGVVAGEWQILYSNFDKIHKLVEVNLGSGNATSYVHNGSNGSIHIYYEPSEQAHDFTITWEHADRALADIRLTSPEGTVYSKSTTPGNIMADEYGKYVIKVPNLEKGSYQFDIKGEGLGRVWVNCEESVFFSPKETEETETTEEYAEAQETLTESEGAGE